MHHTDVGSEAIDGDSCLGNPCSAKPRFSEAAAFILQNSNRAVQDCERR